MKVLNTKNLKPLIIKDEDGKPIREIVSYCFYQDDLVVLTKNGKLYTNNKKLLDLKSN